MGTGNKPHGWTPAVAGLLSPAEVADIIGISWRGLHRLIRQGRIRALRVGRQYWIEPDEVGRFKRQWWCVK